MNPKAKTSEKPLTFGSLPPWKPNVTIEKNKHLKNVSPMKPGDVPASHVTSVCHFDSPPSLMASSQMTYK